MNVSMITKSLLIAVPMLALSACSSNSDSNSDAMEANKVAMAEAQAAADSNIEMDTIEEVVTLSEEELMAQQYSDAILATTIQFDYDDALIKAEFTSILDAHARYLIDNPGKNVTIEGHTDEKGTPEYNIALGEHRAMSVSVYLRNMGVTENQISIVSYGEEKPVSFGHNEASWTDNRRAEMVY